MVFRSASALAVRAGADASPDWWLVLALTAASALAAVAGARLADRVGTGRLRGPEVTPLTSGPRLLQSVGGKSRAIPSMDSGP